MPRYLVERTYLQEVNIPGADHSKQARLVFIENNTLLGVVWIHSYVSPDRKKSYCIYDAPGPEALRRAAYRNDLPIDRIIEVQMLDPYFYIPEKKETSSSVGSHLDSGPRVE
jgi:hypothetical protein